MFQAVAFIHNSHSIDNMVLDCLTRWFRAYESLNTDSAPGMACVCVCVMLFRAEAGLLTF